MNVTSATNSKLQQPQQNATQQATANKAAKTSANQQAKPAQQAHKPEEPRPVVNAQGQVTGKRINVTA